MSLFTWTLQDDLRLERLKKQDPEVKNIPVDWSLIQSPWTKTGPSYRKTPVRYW